MLELLSWLHNNKNLEISSLWYASTALYLKFVILAPLSLKF